MGFFMGKTPKKLKLYIINQDKLVIPYGLKSFILNLLNTRGISYQVNEEHVLNELNIDTNEDITLYDYQLEAIEKIKNETNGILISPCGSGKTMMALSLIKELPYKTLWITHTQDLLNQSYRSAKRLYNNSLGKITEGKVDIGDITFATIQTLCKVDLNAIKDEFTMIIVDECHKATGTPSKLKMFYSVIDKLNAKYKFGVTATLFDKPNDISSTPIFLIGDKLHEIDENKIKRIKASHDVVPLSTPKSDTYLKSDRTLDYMKLVDYLVYNIDRNVEIVKNLINYSNKYNIILSNRNDHLDLIGMLLESYGMEFKILTADCKKKERELILEDFRQGKIRYLLSNYQLFKEGVDVPIADTLHLVFPLNDKTTIIQSAGRVERLYEGKTHSQVVDYVDYNIPYCERLYKERKRILK